MYMSVVDVHGCMYLFKKKLIIGSSNGSLPVLHQSIAWTYGDLLWTGPEGKLNFENIFRRKCISKLFQQNLGYSFQASL